MRKRWFVLATLALAGCGGGELQRTSATVSAQQCPKPASPGPRAAAQSSKALFKALPRLYPTLNREGATVQGTLSLAGGLPTWIKIKRYTTGAASKACGDEVIKASWVAWVLLPNSPKDAANHVVYLVNTSKGWKVWYEWNPQNPEGTVVDV